MSAALPYRPTPVFLGDAEGSTLAVMLFPDDMDAARHWHARFLAEGPLPAYLAADHAFADDRLLAYFNAVAKGEAAQKEVEGRRAKAELAAQVAFNLWASISRGPTGASWKQSILAGAERAGCSESHVRTQLKLFAPVLHLWLAWLVDGRKVVPAPQLFPRAYALLFEIREWEDSRHSAFKPETRYLAAREFGPWPELARQMEGSRVEQPIARRQGL